MNYIKKLFKITSKYESKSTIKSKLQLELNSNLEIDYNKILIVDDDKINRYILNRYIKHINADLIIDEAENGKLAIELSIKTNYRFIFMDVKMPVISGIETTKIILNNRPDAIIYGITGQVEKISIDQAIMAGMKKCIAKPIDKNEIQKLFN
mgnify:CR=1 FL=1